MDILCNIFFWISGIVMIVFGFGIIFGLILILGSLIEDAEEQYGRNKKHTKKNN